MKIGFFATALMRDIDFEEFARFGAEAGYQAMDVPGRQARHSGHLRQVRPGGQRDDRAFAELRSPPMTPSESSRWWVCAGRST